jgi:protein SCO1/2
MKIYLFFFLTITSILLQPILHAHQKVPKELNWIGIEERLNQTIPLNLTFKDEMNHSVSLGQLIHTPVILALIYYSCPDVCSFLLQNLAGVISKLPAEPGKEYVILAISFDENETPELASEKKQLYLKMIERPFPENAWRFLTGDYENIQKLTGSVGFHFKREGRMFQHPVTLVILSSNGKITRYIYGMDFLPFDLKMALLEASEGRVGPTIHKVLRFCFSYDPKGRKYVFNTLKVTGIVTLAFALAFIFFLVFKGRRRKPGKGGL